MNLSSCEEFIREYKEGKSNVEYKIPYQERNNQDFLDCAKKLIALGLVDDRDVIYSFSKKSFMISGAK